MNTCFHLFSYVWVTDDKHNMLYTTNMDAPHLLRFKIVACVATTLGLEIEKEQHFLPMIKFQSRKPRK